MYFGIVRPKAKVSDTPTPPAGPNLRAILENSPDLIAQFDRQGRYLFVNPAMERATRLSARELLGRRVGDAHAARTARRVPGALLAMRRAIKSVVTTGEAVEIDVPIKWPEGERIFRCRLIPEWGDADRVVSVLSIAFDVTDEKRADQLRRQLLAQLLRVREDERRTLARDLHDGIGQAVTALAYGTELIAHAGNLAEAHAHADRLRAIAEETLENLRRLSHGLHPQVLDDLGLAAAVERRATDFIASFGIEVDVVVSGMRGGRLPRSTEATLYGIVTEALTNVARHSGASAASVVLRRKRDILDLMVEDDGRGFDAEAVLAGRNGEAFGLRGIVESAALLGGSARIESAAGRGAMVAVRVPL